MPPMHILALEPYYGGSHRAFLDGWRRHSRHAWSLLTLPAHHWKWRMHHAAWSLAREAINLAHPPDLLFASSMLDLPGFLGMAPATLHGLPRILYFHENQFTYPHQPGERPDYTYGFIQLKSASIADAAWFNSAFHRDDVLEHAAAWLQRMPQPRLPGLLEAARSKAAVQPPGIEPPPPLSPSFSPSPSPHILWAARWEYDKDPGTFFHALFRLQDQGVPFRVSVLGESFSRSPPEFEEARTRLADRVVHWGWQHTRDDFLNVLCDADIVVSTARQEFFGIAVMEAVAAGCAPCVPNRLAYPEWFDPDANPEFFHDGTVDGLVDRLGALIRLVAAGDPVDARACAEPFLWPRRAAELDAAAERLVRSAAAGDPRP